MLIQHLILSQILIALTFAQLFYDEEEIVEDWEDEEWREGKQLLFPQDSGGKGQCMGEKRSLAGGEAAVIKSHRSFGLAPYDDGFRCRWVFQPTQCDLSIVCHLQTRTARSGSRSCHGGDYVRIMRGGSLGVSFHRKYCGKRTASLKFSGNDTVKIVFKTARKAGKAAAKMDGFTCRVVCESKHKPTSTSTTTTTTINPTITTTTTTTSTTTTTTAPTTASLSPVCRCGVVPEEMRRRFYKSLSGGRTPRTMGKIICPPGKSCDSEPVPWQVGISYSYESKPWCGGTIINSRYVLSAAHCFQRKKRDRLQVTLGDLDWSTSGEWPSMKMKVLKVIIHPDYAKKAQFDFDFALLELERPIDFESQDWVRPICLPGGEPVPGEKATVSGWGLTDYPHGHPSTRLQYLQVEVMSEQTCRTKYRGTAEVTENMVCASTPWGDSCSGDSGGPLTTLRRGRHELAGLVSWGVRCADPQYPGVYSKVGVVRDWIRDNTRHSQWCADIPVRGSRGDRRA